MDGQLKLEILATAAKYDASCACSGTEKRDSRDGKGLGSTEGMGICHSYAPDERCIALLKILLTNAVKHFKFVPRGKIRLRRFGDDLRMAADILSQSARAS